MKGLLTIRPAAVRVRFPDLSLELASLMPEAEFIAATSSLNRDKLGAYNGWQRYSIRGLISDDRRLGLFLIFLHGSLKMLSFAYAQKDETRDNWSEEGERQREKEYQQELASQLGGKNTFPWGKVGAKLDSKSGGTDILDRVFRRTHCNQNRKFIMTAVLCGRLRVLVHCAGEPGLSRESGLSLFRMSF